MVVVRCSNEDDRTLTRDIECASRSDLSEEDIGDSSPEDEGGIIDDVRALSMFYSIHGISEMSSSRERGESGWAAVGGGRVEGEATDVDVLTASMPGSLG